MTFTNSPTTRHQFNGRPFFLKRDDLLHPQFSGNKARKFMSLMQAGFPGIKQLIGYGSVQANSLYSLAALCSLRGWKLKFYVDHIPDFVQNKPMGNYRAALALNADIIDLSKVADREGLHAQNYIEKTYTGRKDCLLVPEGGRSVIAEEGIRGLAVEILSWSKQNKIENLTVALPSGTGTTALYLNKYLAENNINVLTCACVGGEPYLIEQFTLLGETEFPQVLQTGKKHHFGRLKLDDYLIWQQLKAQTHVEFDLLYDPLMWRNLQPWLEENPDHTLLYIHQGGLLANETMLPRYQRKYDTC